MSDESPEYAKELTFKNTPLQNLKNILSDADASVEVDVVPMGAESPALASTGESEDGVNRSAIQSTIDELKQNQEQYFPRARVQEIVQELCLGGVSKEKGSGIFFQDPAVLRLDALINDNNKI